MIIIINKAILHILDFNSGMTLFSEQELDANNNSVLTFLTKHIEKICADPNAKPGAFHPDSEFKKQMTAYLDGHDDFLSFSQYIGQTAYSALSQTETPEPCDVVISDVTIDDNRFVAIFKCNNKTGFTHHVTVTDGKVTNDIINHCAILPSLTQKIDEYALIEINTLAVKFNDKKKSLNGETAFVIPEFILDCSSSVSQKNAIDLVKTITHKVSEAHGQSTVAAVAKAKQYIVENAENSEYLSPLDLGKTVFASSPLLQDEYRKEVQNAGIPAEVKVDRDFAIKKGRNHKIKTDTEIELLFPVDYFENKDFIEFINKSDGTISIELKNIGKIINK